ncbi:pseudouridylate synthase [Chitinophaga sp. 30R24]|uniref:pseudouridylate synthase n=1 Tax=Chitinophaga sp. 30R24 TaxID=3248838 RepID=UPI003B91C802
MHSPAFENSVFCPFKDAVSAHALAAGLTFSVDNEKHPLCMLAAEELQSHLRRQQEWSHNFGFTADVAGAVIGKMFGVLVVRTSAQQLGYLAAFSGKLAGGNHHTGFVPPIFDGVAASGFLNEGMTQLTYINQKIRSLEQLSQEDHKEEIQRLKALRKDHSVSLQKKIYDQYHFINKAGISKSLVEIFENAAYKNPPAGAGECAAPKLLQYAFRHHMEPLALAEFWWGLSPKSATWKHGQFYPPCHEKCAPILAHMLT